MPFKNCPICFQQVFVKSNKKSIYEHIAQAHPHELEVMKANGGFASRTPLQHEILGMADRATGSCSGLTPVVINSPSLAAHPAMDHLANRLGSLALRPEAPRNSDVLMYAEPVSKDALICVLCGLYYPLDVSNREIGKHYRECMIKSQSGWHPSH